MPDVRCTSFTNPAKSVPYLLNASCSTPTFAGENKKWYSTGWSKRKSVNWELGSLWNHLNRSYWKLPVNMVCSEPGVNHSVADNSRNFCNTFSSCCHSALFRASSYSKALVILPTVSTHSLANLDSIQTRCLKSTFPPIS